MVFLFFLSTPVDRIYIGGFSKFLTEFEIAFGENVCDNVSLTYTSHRTFVAYRVRSVKLKSL